MSDLRRCPVCRDARIRRLDQRTCGRECMGIWNTWTNQQKARAIELADDAIEQLPGDFTKQLEQILSPNKPAEEAPLPDILKGFADPSRDKLP